MDAGYGRDRDKLFKTWSQLARTSHQKITAIEVFETIDSLTSGETFGRYVNVDDPYRLGAITKDVFSKGLIPEGMKVEATTTLDLSNPMAKGYLTFQKKKYMEYIGEAFT